MLQEEFFKSANPYGKATQTVIEEFELQIGSTLPQSYRDYLLVFNGGEPNNSYFFSDRKPKGSYNLHHVFGLHTGPRYLRLQENWKTEEYYDLEKFGDTLRNYLTIAQCGTGELLLVNMESGTVHLLDPEIDNLEAGDFVFTKPVQSGSNFEDFVRNLKDLSQILNARLTSDERDGFNQRVAELRQRAQKDNE